jgi:hypothetical protein
MGLLAFYDIKMFPDMQGTCFKGAPLKKCLVNQELEMIELVTMIEP